MAARELLYFLAWRDLKVRYKQTALGVVWAVLQPLVTMFVFTLVFHRLAKIDSGAADLPYPVFVYAGLLPWLLFQSSLTRASESIVAEARLITKVYFPRLLVPFSTVISALVDFLIAFVILLGLMWYYQVTPTWNILYLPLFAFLAVLTALSVGLWLTALNARYRDVRYIVPFMVRIWMFLTPVAYPSARLIKQLPPDWAWLYQLNPLVGVVEGFRWALFGEMSVDGSTVLISTAVTMVLLLGGLWYFRRMERTFADVV